MTDKLENIEHEIDETRSDLAEKIGQIGDKIWSPVEAVEETVEAVAETTEEAVESVAGAFNINKQAEKHPWLLMGGSVLVGFVGGYLINRMVGGSDQGRRDEWQQPRYEPRYEPQPQQSARAEARQEPEGQDQGGQGEEEQSSWMKPLSALKDQFAPQLEQAKGLALGTVLHLFRDVVVDLLPRGFRDDAEDIFGQVESQVVGKGKGRQGDESGRGHEQGNGNGSAQKWEGRWDQLAGKAKQTWGQVTDDDLKKAEGSYDRLVGIIKERTGETREQIESRLQEQNA